ncbi:MAG TPA: hypothetical protein VLI06_00935 [Solimonas sp.]|nr:hypothetical protein [Solimonas sp.]
MGLTYFDETEGRTRIKRRYLWGMWGYAAGVVSALFLLAWLT